MGKSRAKWSGKDKHPFEDNPFIEDFIDWMGSSEGQDSIEALDLVFDALQNVDVDARRRKIVWPDGKRLSIEESAARLHAEHPDMSCDLIETHVLGWLGGCAPESYTDEQMKEFDQLMEPWLEDYECKRSAGRK
jgi:hypothetical protein